MGNRISGIITYTLQNIELIFINKCNYNILTVNENKGYKLLIAVRLQTRSQIMNYKSLLLSAIIGISAPILTESVLANPAPSNSPLNSPYGGFYDEHWIITINIGKSGYTYEGFNKRTNSSIKILTAPQFSGNKERQVYTWVKNKHRYQVAFRVNQPNVIRLQVFNPAGKEILNRLLQRSTEGAV